MKTRTYAKEITKEFLESLGITNVTPDGYHVYRGEKELKQFFYNKKKNYLGVSISVYDAAARANTPKEERKSSTGQTCYTLGMHVLNYVWNKGTSPEGYVVDHIDNNPLNNNLNNLQLLTPAENLAKDNVKYNTKKIRMPKYITLEEIYEKLNHYIALYEEAKANHDAHKAHSLRGSISDWKSKLRQYLENPEAYKRPADEQKNKLIERYRKYHKKTIKNIRGAIKVYREEILTREEIKQCILMDKFCIEVAKCLKEHPLENEESEEELKIGQRFTELNEKVGKNVVLNKYLMCLYKLFYRINA